MVEEIKGDASGVSSLNIKNTATNEKRELVVPGLFIFVGYDVNNAVLKQEDGSMLCECDEYGSIVVDFSMKTNVQGLFAAGDIRIFAPKQVVCARKRWRYGSLKRDFLFRTPLNQAYNPRF